MDEDGTIHMNPNFLAQIRQEFPNTMSRMIIACDDGTFRSNKAADAIMSKLGHTNVKVLEGGIDAYLKAFPIDKSANKWNARPEIGQDLSTLVSGVDTRQAGADLLLIDGAGVVCSREVTRFARMGQSSVFVYCNQNYHNDAGGGGGGRR